MTEVTNRKGIAT